MAWTAPDPLVLNSKTRSIYITELQDYCNLKRTEIGKPSISFINQSIGTQFKLSAIEELKEAVNTLAEDFGYIGGVTHVDLLGRYYVNITNIYGNKVTHFPIINDLRRVLETAEDQNETGVGISPGFMATNWYTPLSGRAMAAWDETGDPWVATPNDTQLGSNGLPEDSTIPGEFPGIIISISDKYITYYNSDNSKYYQGPFNTEYYENPGMGTLDRNVYDNTHNFYGVSNGSPLYFIGTLEKIIYKVDLRIPIAGGNQSSAKVEIARVPGVHYNTIYSDLVNLDIVATSLDNIYLIYSGAIAGPNVYYRGWVAVVGKNGGVIGPIQIPMQFLTPGLDNTGAHNYELGDYWFVDYNGNLIGSYYEYFKDWSNTPPSDPITYIASARITISPSGSINTSHIVQAQGSTAGWYDTVHRFAPADIAGVSNNGVYYYVGSAYVGALPYPPSDSTLTFEGSALSPIDYKGDTIVNRAITPSLSYWTSRAGSPAILVPVEFSAINNETDGTTTFQFIHQPGAFRYQVQKRIETGTTWSSVGLPINLEDIFTLGVVDNPVEKNSNISSTSGQYVRLVMESAQGLLISSETFIPAGAPGKVENLALGVVGGNQIYATWDNPSEGVIPTGYYIEHLNFISTISIDVGLVNTYTSVPLAGTGITRFFRIRAYSATGIGAWVYSSITF